ncbi:MAG TPA: SIMPL domain-containing protein [Patescibacteria group bacterium]|nr:SIMPL domain-containing protein [Patescibacteria group bacterium]
MDNETKNLNINPPFWGLVLATVVVVFLAIFLGVLTRNELKKYDYIGRESQQTYTITIDGEGKVTAIPDIAQISLGIQTDKSTVAQAQQENTDKMNKIIDELKKMGIEAKDIKTTNYSIYPRYDWTSGTQILRGYAVSQNVTVKIRDLEKVGAIVDRAGNLGANEVGGLNFTIDEPEKLRQDAREIALGNAKEKAEALAKVAGVKLGKLVSFSENGVTPPPIYRDYALKSLEAGASDQAVAPSVEPGSQEIIVNVMVTYEVL